MFNYKELSTLEGALSHYMETKLEDNKLLVEIATAREQLNNAEFVELTKSRTEYFENLKNKLHKMRLTQGIRECEVYNEV